MNKKVTVEIPSDLADWLEQKAVENEWPRDYLMSVILAAARAKSASENSFGKHVGSVKGTPHDLSTRKGFDKGNGDR